MKKRLKEWTLENFWTHFEVLHYKQSSEFMIPTFHDCHLVPKITKCGDLLYSIKKVKVVVPNVIFVKAPEFRGFKISKAKEL